MSTLQELRAGILGLTRRERALKTWVQISGIPRAGGQDREHIAWAVVDRNWTRAQWAAFYDGACRGYTNHGELHFVLHVSRHAARWSFGDRTLDLTGMLAIL